MGATHTRRVTVAIDAEGQPSDTFSGRAIGAVWNGGAYVDLDFGGHATPAEVINVYNYATRTIDPRVHTPAGLRSIVRDWVAGSVADWPDYYDSYVRNSFG